jgi:hypothetical protein
VIFSRPDAGLAEGFGIVVGVGRSAVASAIITDLGDESLATGSLVAGLSVADAGGTSTLVNVLCGSNLNVTCVGTTPLRASTPTESSML